MDAIQANITATPDTTVLIDAVTGKEEHCMDFQGVF